MSYSLIAPLILYSFVLPCYNLKAEENLASDNLEICNESSNIEKISQSSSSSISSIITTVVKDSYKNPIPITLIDELLIPNITQNIKFLQQFGSSFVIITRRRSLLSVFPTVRNGINISHNSKSSFPLQNKKESILDSVRTLFTFLNANHFVVLFFNVTLEEEKVLRKYVKNKRLSVSLCFRNHHHQENNGKVNYSVNVIIIISSCFLSSSSSKFSRISHEILGTVRNRHLMISSFLIPPYIVPAPASTSIQITTLTGQPSKSATNYNRWDGINYRLVFHASQALNFSFHFYVHNMSGSGSMSIDGIWNGEFAQIFYDEYDVGVAYSPGLDTFRAIDLVWYYGLSPLLFTTARPHEHTSKFAFLHPYSNLVWLLIFLSVFLVTIVLFIIKLLSSMSRNHFPHHNQFASEHGLIERCQLSSSLLLSLGILFEQPVSIIHQPKRDTLAKLGVLWVFTSAIISAGYKATLECYLLKPDLEPRPRSFTDLTTFAEDYKIYYEMKGKQSSLLFNKSLNNYVFSPLLDRLSPRVIVEQDSSKCILNSLMEPKSVCIGWEDSLYLHVGMNATLTRGSSKEVLLFSTGKALRHRLNSLILQKNSIFTKAFQFIADSYLESGIYLIWRQDVTNQYKSQGIKWLQKSKDSPVRKKISELIGQNKYGRPLTRSDISFAVVLTAALLTLALLIFFVEVWIGAGWRDNRDRNRKKRIKYTVQVQKVKAKVEKNEGKKENMQTDRKNNGKE